MVEIKLKYNPYTKEKVLEIAGVIQKESEVRNICGADEKDIFDWSMDLYKNILKKENDSFTLYFTGIQRDYEIMEDSLKKFLEDENIKNSSIKILLKEDKIISVNNQLIKLKSLFKKMQEESPFDELKTEKLKRLFEKVTNSEFEMVVIATVSSGKSTLINAMLGTELLPVANEATTATIARIHQRNELNCFNGISYTKDGKEKKYDPISIEEMKLLNKDSNISKIEIYGPIGIETNDIKLVLTDSPGPNNSSNIEHKEHTINLLNEDYKPIVIYVLNATQLEVNDDENLLKIISEKMKENYRQSRDRFLFILNKADEFDPDKGEKIAKKIENVKEYLKKFGIENPRVFQTTARLAKELRRYMKKQELTKHEKNNMDRDVDNAIDLSDHCFCKYANFLSQETINKHKEKINETEKSDDKYKKALFYTGIPSLEIAISEYLSKYSIPIKIYEGVLCFNEKIKQLNIEAKENVSLENNEKKLSEVKDNLEKISKIIYDGNEFLKLKKDIENIKIDKEELNQIFEEENTYFLHSFTDPIQDIKKSSLPEDEFNGKIKKLKKNLYCFILDYKNKISKIVEEIFKKQVKKYIENYEKYVEKIIGKNEFKISKEFYTGTFSTFSIDDFFDDYSKYERIHYEEKEEEIDNPEYYNVKGSFLFPKWLKRLFIPKTTTIKYKVKKGFVDGIAFAEDLYQEIYNFTQECEKITYNESEEEMKIFRHYMLKQISRLNKKINEKINEKKENLKNKTNFSKMIEKNKKNLEWLNIFKKDLNSILDI